MIWTNGHIIDLGSLPEGGRESTAFAVNSAGQVVGAALNATPNANPLLSLPFSRSDDSDTSVSVGRGSDAGFGYLGRHRRAGRLHQ